MSISARDRQKDLLNYWNHVSPANSPKQYEVILVACARGEADSIVEWLNYHRSIGVDHVYLYGSDDDPGQLYERVMPFLVGDDCFVTYKHYPYQNQQLHIYRHAIWNYSSSARWLLFLDVDEFLCLRHSDNIHSFLERFLPEVDCLYLNRCCFGSNGFTERPLGSILQNYVLREAMAAPLTKTLIRTTRIPWAELVRNPHIEMMHDWSEVGPDMNIQNVIGDPMRTYRRDWPHQAWAYLNTADVNQRILDTAYVAHYGEKSESRMNEGESAAHRHHANAVEDAYLKDYWSGYLAQAERFNAFPPRRWPLISTNAVADQCSLVPVHSFRSLRDDATLPLREPPQGTVKNHTDRQLDPWWQADLGASYTLREIRVFNRMDGALDRLSRMRIEASVSGADWLVLHEKDDDHLFGGIEGLPFVHELPTPVDARYVRIVVLGDTYLHFDRIEVYGEPCEGAP